MTAEDKDRLAAIKTKLSIDSWGANAWISTDDSRWLVAEVERLTAERDAANALIDALLAVPMSDRLKPDGDERSVENQVWNACRAVIYADLLTVREATDD